MGDPGGVLGEIVARKRVDVALRLEGVTIDQLRAQAQPTLLSLRNALAAPGARFVMEVKRASPSQGVLRADLDPAAQARAYRGTADGISVLTDTPYFGGSLADLQTVRSVFEGPILAKDFVVDPRQVPEARLAGADAVLVMLSVLDDEEARGVMAEADRLNMDVLVEAHDEEEVERAVALGARIIGINNRDLKSLKVDLATTERLAPLVPKDRLLVCESGIKDRRDVERLAPLVDAFLVGSSLMQDPRPAQAARRLAFGRVKICGLTRAADVQAAADAGASIAGLIFVPGTPRALGRGEAAGLAATADACGIAKVGVFRDQAADDIIETAVSLKLDAVQLHGGEDEAYISSLRAALPEGIEIWTTRSVRGRIAPSRGGDRSLFDTQVNGQSGGTGTAFDWSLLNQEPGLDQAILAGGLDAGNCAQAAAKGAWSIDACSGVEASPGRKDPVKLNAFFNALRAAKRTEKI